MSETISKLIGERLYARESSLQTLSDSIDSKASYVLVVITFLALQLTGLLGKHAPHLLIYLSALALTAGAAFIGVVLWPRNFDYEKPEGWNSWLHEPDNQDRSDEEIASAIRHGLEDRVRGNNAILKTRSLWMYRSFFAVGVSLALNLICLVCATFSSSH